MINDYVGVPFGEGGRTPEYWDCWGLVFYVAEKEFGINYPSYSEQYTTPLDYKELKNLIGHESTTNWTEIEQGNEKPGDVIILRLRNMPIHAGLVVKKNKMLHVYNGIETAIEDYTRLQWKHRISGFFRYNE